MGQHRLNLTGKAGLDLAEFKDSRSKGTQVTSHSLLVNRESLLLPVSFALQVPGAEGAVVGPALKQQHGSVWAEPRAGLCLLRKPCGS